MISCVAGSFSSQIRNWFGPRIDVRDVVRLALVLEQVHASDVEGLGEFARRIVDRHAREVALHVARHAVALILVIAWPPIRRREVGLGVGAPPERRHSDPPMMRPQSPRPS